MLWIVKRHPHGLRIGCLSPLRTAAPCGPSDHRWVTSLAGLLAHGSSPGRPAFPVSQWLTRTAGSPLTVAGAATDRAATAALPVFPLASCANRGTSTGRAFLGDSPSRRWRRRRQWPRHVAMEHTWRAPGRRLTPPAGTDHGCKEQEAGRGAGFCCCSVGGRARADAAPPPTWSTSPRLAHAVQPAALGGAAPRVHESGRARDHQQHSRQRREDQRRAARRRDADRHGHAGSGDHRRLPRRPAAPDRRQRRQLPHFIIARPHSRR